LRFEFCAVSVGDALGATDQDLVTQRVMQPMKVASTVQVHFGKRIGALPNNRRVASTIR
jgi:hypothetical protein